MWLRNNSKHKWDEYDCGNNFLITIEPESEFEVEDKYANVLLKNLGSDKWLVISQDPKTIEEKKEIETKVQEVQKEEIKKEETKKEKFNLESFLQDNVDTSGKI